MNLLQIDKDTQLLNVVSENGYLFTWVLSDTEKLLVYARKIQNGSIEALNVRKVGKKITGVCCSSDCTFSLLEFDIIQKS